MTLPGRTIFSPTRLELPRTTDEAYKFWVPLNPRISEGEGLMGRLGRCTTCYLAGNLLLSMGFRLVTPPIDSGSDFEHGF